MEVAEVRSQNFQPLQKRWPQLYEHANFAEKYAHTDPHTAIMKLRCFAEQLVGILYKELSLPCERSDGFFEKLKSNIFIEVIDENILEKLHAIRMLGNKAAHGRTGVVLAGPNVRFIDRCSSRRAKECRVVRRAELFLVVDGTGVLGDGHTIEVQLNRRRGDGGGNADGSEGSSNLRPPHGSNTSMVRGRMLRSSRGQQGGRARTRRGVGGGHRTFISRESKKYSTKRS